MEMSLKKLLEYNHYANLKLFEYIDGLNLEEDHRITILAHHIINAQEIWINRILGHSISLDVWAIRQDLSLKELELNCQPLYDGLNSYSPDTEVTYINSSQQKFTNIVSDILFHVINHGTNHRGQINTLLRQHYFEPVIVDYIFYIRES